MRRGLRLLMAKEVKDLLRDPKILVGMILFPALIYPLMGAAMSISTGSVIETASANMTIYMIDDDGGPLASTLKEFFRGGNFTVEAVEGDPASMAASLHGGDVLIHVPSGFSENITAYRRADIGIFVNFKEFSIVEFIKAGRAEGIVRIFEGAITNALISNAFPNAKAEDILNPVKIDYNSVIRGEAQPINPEVLQNTMRLQGAMGPIVILLVLILAMQVAATSIAVEKEAKTLETLLTIPVSRLSILFSKLIGSFTIAFLASVATVLSFSYYFTTVLGTAAVDQGLDLSVLGIGPSSTGFIVLGATLFGALLSALALALTLGTLAQDVRGAQSLVGVLMVPVIMPMFFIMFGDMSSLPAALQTALYLIPFTYPMLASQALFTGNYGTVFVGLAYMAAFTFVTLYLAAKVFSSERIMTARLSFRLGRIKR
ncbi:MAG: ABC transporter permease [Candidatus Methanomethylicia archaeon]|nr:ABC transporter permease [Candidatus Methanomethylicia archaeon]